MKLTKQDIILGLSLGLIIGIIFVAFITSIPDPTPRPVNVVEAAR